MPVTLRKTSISSSSSWRFIICIRQGRCCMRATSHNAFAALRWPPPASKNTSSSVFIPTDYSQGSQKGPPCGGPLLRDVGWRYLSPAETALRKRKRTDSLAAGGEDRVADGGKQRRKRGFAQTGRRVGRRQEMDFDLRRSLRQTNHLVLMKVRLHRPAL